MARNLRNARKGYRFLRSLLFEDITKEEATKRVQDYYDNIRATNVKKTFISDLRHLKGIGKLQVDKINTGGN